MKIRSIALLAMCISLGLSAAGLSGATLAVYYSFDNPPSDGLVTEMQSELGRILEAADVRIAWRTLDSARSREDFPELVVLRFQGVCSVDSDPRANEQHADPDGPLAKTDVADGHVLPFGTVDCDRLRQFIGPTLKLFGPDPKSAGFGRAMARVSAHEIYHMLTRSGQHARQGIGRAAYSRGELSAPTFAFGPEETNWLRSWVAKASSPAAPVASAAQSRTDAPEAESPALEPSGLSGR